MRCSNCVILTVCEDEVLCCVNGIGAFDELYRIMWTEGLILLTGSFCCTNIYIEAEL
jgi:hypothetical protein